MYLRDTYGGQSINNSASKGIENMKLKTLRNIKIQIAYEEVEASKYLMFSTVCLPYKEVTNRFVGHGNWRLHFKTNYINKI